MKQRRLQPFELGLRLSSFDDAEDCVEDPISTLSFVEDLSHKPDQWRGSFSFYASALDTSRDMFGHPDLPAMTGLSLWRYPFPSLADLN